MPANRTYVLGLTGGTGCGKSEAAQFLRSLGAQVADADAISRALTAPGGAALPEIRRYFGDGVFSEDGSLNRRALGERIFHDPAAKTALEGAIHPRVRSALEEAVRTSVARVTVLDVPLLFETGMEEICDEVWTMSADEETQIARVCARDGLSAEQARARIAGQMSMAERNARADRVIDSRRPIEQTRAALRLYYGQLLEKIG